MNPTVTSLISVGILLAASLTARRLDRDEARWATVAAMALATLSSVATGVFTLAHGVPESLRVGPLLLQVDALTATLQLPMALAGLALALGMARAQADRHLLAALGLVVAAGHGTLLAGNAATLIPWEIVGLSAAIAALHHTRAARLAATYLGAAMLLLLLAAGSMGLETLTLPLDRLAERAPGSWIFAIGGAAAIRMGLFPFPTWITRSFQEGPTAPALVAALPLTGVPLLVRVIEPALAARLHVEPLQIGAPLLASALLFGLVSASQADLGRAVAWLLAAAHALLAAALLDPSPVGIAGGELLWAALLLSGTGFGLAAAGVRARAGALDLERYAGLFDAAPSLGVMLLLLGMGIAGIPGTLEFVGTDVLLHGSLSEEPLHLVLAVAAVCAAGFSVLRVFTRTFFGPPPTPLPDLRLLPRERLALLILLGALVAGGVAPGFAPLLRAVPAVGMLP